MSGPRVSYHMNYSKPPISGSPSNSVHSMKSRQIAGKNEKEPEGLVRTLRYFANVTSFQAIPHINRSPNRLVKAFWTLLFMGAVVVATLHCYTIMKSFLARDVTTQVDITYDTLPFPSVTVCNANAIRRSQVHLGGEELIDFVDRLQPHDGYNGEHEESMPVTTQEPPKLPRTVGARGTGEEMETTGDRFKRATDNKAKGGFNPFKEEKNLTTQYQQYTMDAEDPDDTEDFGGADLSVEFLVQEELRQILATVPEDVRVDMGHTIDAMLLSCQFNGRSCFSDDFTEHLNPKYGNCFTYNTPFIKARSLRSRESGSQYGLKMILFLEKNEYVSGITEGSGVVIDVHPFQTMAFPEHNGISVAPGTTTNVAMRMIQLERLGHPYRACESGALFRKNHNMTYTIEGCVHTCLDKKIAENCKCRRPVYGSYYGEAQRESLKPCSSEEQNKCAYEMRRDFENGQIECDCLQACRQTSYNVEYSYSSWPETDLWHTLVNRICESDEKSCGVLKQWDKDEHKIVLMDNFLTLNVYFKELNLETISESPAYETGQFVSDFGGAMGLWMGASALTIIELVDLVFRLCHRGCCQKGKSNKKFPGNGTPPDGGEVHKTTLGHLHNTYLKDYAMDNNVSGTLPQHRLPRLYA